MTDRQRSVRDRAVLLAVEVRHEQDIVLARQRARQVAGLLGFEPQDQTRIATAVSELARNAHQYARGGRVEFSLRGRVLEIRVADEGPGIPDLERVLSGRYDSRTGMGLGILGARRLMDQFGVSSTSQGTVVTLGKELPSRVPAPGTAELRRLADELAHKRASDPLLEIQHQNQELLRALEGLRHQQTALEQVNRELEETNRGVVALYAELDERADYLQRANEIKTRFLSNMTHEFRTPLNSIISLTRVLLQRIDGELTPEQEKQVRFIARSSEELSELVNDLLDLAKVEAGKIVVRPAEFSVGDLFAALRGMLRPLLAQNSSLNLVFTDPDPELRLFTDEAKVSQIVRNFISNAIKYTERGEIRVSASATGAGVVIFEVADTGIGIAAEDQQRIFEDFVQVDSPMQRRVKGTGLGLPLSRKLAGLLGGSVHVKSEVGVGSTFSATVPRRFSGPTELVLGPEAAGLVDPGRDPVLVVEDNREAVFVYEKYLKGSGFQVVPARTVAEARAWLSRVDPVAVILDILLQTESTWEFLSELRREERTRDLPVLVITMIENEARALAVGADAFHAKPVERDWLLGKLTELTRNRSWPQVLVVDDDEVSRYLLRGLLSGMRLRVREAASGAEGLHLAREIHPDVIFLDLLMAPVDGYAVLESLQTEPELSRIPVIVHTSKQLADGDRERLRTARAVFPKESASREAALAGLRAALAAAGLRPGTMAPAREGAHA